MEGYPTTLPSVEVLILKTCLLHVYYADMDEEFVCSLFFSFLFFFRMSRIGLAINSYLCCDSADERALNCKIYRVKKDISSPTTATADLVEFGKKRGWHDTVHGPTSGWK